ncbi:hypothetical protein [Nissabacter archeti]|uniref:hypothetical protein n=1 Tax=Nissabacter archeti TaxID=1917880 RepID=UPI001115227E|nr:hypothetical protein [Nissabacter archeti]
MPVDLSCIPAPAKRHAAPSLKRWLVSLVILITGGSVLTIFLWPANLPMYTSAFWFCTLGVPICGGLTIISIRWLFYLTTEWLADGWDNARKREITHNIQRGQRNLVLIEQVIHLPHIISRECLSQQLLMSDVITLPTIIDDSNQQLIHHCCFKDTSVPLQDRRKERLRALFADAALQKALQRLPQTHQMAVMLQINLNEPVSAEEINTVQQSVREMIGFSFNLNFIEGDGLLTVDTWLDNPTSMQTLLIIALNVLQKRTDGTGEAAVALLLHSSDLAQSHNIVAHIHRPEQTRPDQGINAALQQALHWGIATPEDISHIWLAGAGTGNKASSLLSTAGILFPNAGQPCDIDIKTGLTGGAAPWLAIAVASEQAAHSNKPQLVMSMTDNSSDPWFITIRPSVN